MNDKNSYKSKLRSSKQPAADNKSEIFSPKSEISKNSKKSSRNQNISSKKYSKIRCNDCKELINEEDLQRHKENCVKNQKKCPHCKEFFPTRLINSHINVCNTSSFVPNSNTFMRNSFNARMGQHIPNNEPRPQVTPNIRKPNISRPEPHSREIPTFFGGQNQPNSNPPHGNRANPMFPNINIHNNSRRSNNATNNNANANNANTNSIPRDPFSSIFEDFSSPSSPPHFYHRFTQDNNGNQFFFSNEFSSSENNNSSQRQSNNFPGSNPQPERERNNAFSHAFSQRANNTNNSNSSNAHNHNQEGSNMFFSSNSNNNNGQNNFGNPFPEFDRIFGPSGVFTRIRDEMRNLMGGPSIPTFQRTYAFRAMPFEREESEANRIFDSFSFFIDPIFVTFRNSRENRARGLNPDEINNIPTSTFNPAKPPSQDKKDQNTTAKSCVVCLDDFKNGDQMKTLICQHKFHQACIDHWLVIKGSCPVCRVNLSRPEV